VASDGPTPSKVPSNPATAPSQAAAANPARRLRNVLLVVAGFLVTLGAVAAGTLFYFYDQATAIDRSTPEVVVSQFLRAALVEKDPRRLSLFTCQQWSTEGAMAAAAPPADERIAASWGGDLAAEMSGGSATVDVRVQFADEDGALAVVSKRVWTFELENQDGWRVCSLTKGPLLDP